MIKKILLSLLLITFLFSNISATDEYIISSDKLEERPSIGSTDASIIIIEYSDFECPFCQNFYLNTYDKLKEEFIDSGNVNFIFKDFPLSFHKLAEESAIAGKCVFYEEGDNTFFKFHNIIFENQDDLSTSNLKNWALDIGVNEKNYDLCIQSDLVKEQVNKDFSEGESLGISGTPSFIINDELLVGAQPYSVFEERINNYLKNTVYGISSRKLKERPYIGKDYAAVTIVWFSDLEDPFSARFNDQSYDRLKENFIDSGNVNLIYKDFPLSFHKLAEESAIAGKCVFYEEGDNTFFKFHNIIFENQDDLSTSNLKNWALDIGVNEKNYDLCIQSDLVKEQVNKDFSEGESLGISGTPSFIINDELLVGAQPYSVFEKIINKKLVELDYNIEEKDNYIRVSNEEEEEIKIKKVNSKEICNGCNLENTCFDIGIRMLKYGTSSYCDINKEFNSQKEIGAMCQNNFECRTNTCSSGVCVDIVGEVRKNRSLLESITKWFNNLFWK